MIPNPKCLTKLTAEVTIHPGTDAEGSAIDQAYIKFDQLAITIQVWDEIFFKVGQTEPELLPNH